MHVFWKREQKDCKSYTTRVFSVIMCVLVMSEATAHEISPTWLPKIGLNKDNRHAKMHRKETTKPQPYIKCKQGVGIINIHSLSISVQRKKKQTDILLCHFPTGKERVGQSFEQSDFSGDNYLKLKIQWYSNAGGTWHTFAT